MAVSGMTGPLVVFGQNPAQAGTNYQPDNNGDQGPSAFFGGIMTLDPRYGYRAALQSGTLAAIGFFQTSEHLVVDQVPSTAAVANVATAFAAVANLPLVLVTVTGAGVTVSTAPLTIPQSGITLPAGTRFLDGPPGQIFFGQNGAVAVVDPRTMLSRVVSITSSSGATGTTFTVRGIDVFGFAVTEVITQVAGTTVFGRKGFKAVLSVTPATTDAAHTYSVGTGDVFEFPLMTTAFSQTQITWNNGDIAANTGFLAADTTSPATGTTGSVRGTYAVQSASDGTKRLQVSIAPPPQNMGAVNGAASLFGVVQFSG